MSAQPSGVPTTVSAAGPACAQPLAQPETWIVNEPSRCGAAASAMRGAMARAAICADAQIGAPAQANDMPARIVGADDEAKLVGGSAKRWRASVP